MLSKATGKEVFAVPNNIHISKSSASHDPNRNYQPIGVIERGFVSERITYDQITKSRVPNVRTTRTKFRKEILTVYRLDRRSGGRSRGALRRRRRLARPLRNLRGRPGHRASLARISCAAQAQAVAELPASLAELGAVRAGVCRTVELGAGMEYGRGPPQDQQDHRRWLGCADSR